MVNVMVFASVKVLVLVLTCFVVNVLVFASVKVLESVMVLVLLQ